MAPKPPPRPFQLDVFSTTVTLPPFSAAAAAHAQPAKPAPMTRMSVSTVDVTSVMGSGTTSHAYCVSPPAAALPAASPPAVTSPALAAGEQPARPAPAATAAVAPRPRNARRDSPFFMMSVIGNPFPR